MANCFRLLLKLIIGLGLATSTVKLSAQLMKLDSVLAIIFKADKVPAFLAKNDNGQRLPIFVPDKTFISLFDINDGLLDSIKIDVFTSKEEMINSYGLKRDGKSILFVRLSVLEATSISIQLQFNYGIIVCDRDFFRNKWLFKRNGYTVIEYDLAKRTFQYFEVAW